MTDRLVHESDWLASRPYFYNSVTGKSSESIGDVIDYQHCLLEPEGLHVFFDFGYAAFGQTPVQNVRFLTPSSQLWQKPNGELFVQSSPDPVEDWIDYRLSEQEIIELIRTRVREWEATHEGEVVLPLSGGYDSRLLAWCLSGSDRVRAVTYGISRRQHKSAEVALAQEVAKRLDLRWDQIPLGGYHKYLNTWYDLFGISTHAHGMYHLEFYSKVRTMGGGVRPLLSGILGDAWAGSIPQLPINSPQDVPALAYSHGVRADTNALKVKATNFTYQTYFDANREVLKDLRLQTVAIARFKMILLSYLIRVPKEFGFRPWSPFLDIDIAMAMLNLPPSRRSGRLWQKDFFRRQGLHVDDLAKGADRANMLDRQALRMVPVPPLDAKALGPVVTESYVEWINRHVRTTRRTEAQRVLLELPRIGAALIRAGANDLVSNAYSAYVCVWPIQKLLTDAAHARI